MRPDVVVDVGNTSIKWGRCAAGRVEEVCRLPPDAPDTWREQAAAWGLPSPSLWVVTGVHPQRRTDFAEHLCSKGERVHILTAAASLPLCVRLDRPDQVGLDRLLDAVAVNSRRPAGVPALIVDAGSAVTVDWVDEDGAFVGGAILPGLRLMAAALHEHTALLPVIPPPREAPPLPGDSTTAAMVAGIFWAVAGGVRAIIEQYEAESKITARRFLTGGDGPALQAVLPEMELWPTMTLEGIRLSAEALP